jgi:hypothetical protein
MRTRMKEILGGMTIVFFVTVTFSGCVPLLIGAAAGAGGIVYVQGALVQNLDEMVEDIHRATLAGLKDLSVFVASDELNRHSARIKAEYEDGTKIDVKVDAITEFVSKVTIRIGMIGDSDASRTIMNAIEDNL